MSTLVDDCNSLFLNHLFDTIFRFSSRRHFCFRFSFKFSFGCSSFIPASDFEFY